MEREQRIAILASRVRTGQHHPGDPPGMPPRELLRHRAAEGHTEHGRIVTPHKVHQRGSVIGIVGHAVRLVRLLGLAEPALIVAQNGETIRERVDIRLPLMKSNLGHEPTIS